MTDGHLIDASADSPAPRPRPTFGRNQATLSVAQLLSGVGIAVGFAVGGLLAEHLTGSAAYAGFAQTASILGAATLAIPLARLAQRTSRRRALTTGFGIALAGSILVLVGAGTGSAPVFFVGMLAFGSSTAAGFQARYAATDDAPVHRRAVALSIVVWATTLGSVAGPNLAGPAGRLGRALGVGELGGPFVVSAVVFLLASLTTLRLRSPGHAPASTPTGTRTIGVAEGLREVVAAPRALLGFAAVVLGHTVMVSVMVMTPVHMDHHGDSITIIGLVISLHILGMYALSPVYGWLSDRYGATRVIWAGFAILVLAATLGLVDDVAGSSTPRITAALVLLGLGWSACFIAGSSLLTASIPEEHRVPIQGTADAAMNVGAAVFAAAAGPLLELGGFTLINAVALTLVAAGVTIAIRSTRPGRLRGA
ncbi:MFS transporter [Pseudactinotalea sp. HY158]|uniref:MFS transporter n=1 Tax=Pseudactinotalea sp. HY158 TaxID=2654547 RepID=UPI00129C60C5|nr:MFS transporter [Pseudactinotalea sp. HY158]QGH68975.1 MFS transporter [Pseudactinotalea sp. HY158]